MSERARLAAIHEGRTPGPWVRGWWSAQAEAKCDCARKGTLLGKRPQNEYPGAGPFHVHETDFFEDEHRLSGPAPECEPVAGNYDYEEGGIIRERDSRAIAAWERTYGPLLDLWHEASWLVGIWADSIQRGSALREDILALRRALAAVEAAAKEVPE